MSISIDQFWESLTIEITNQCNLSCRFCPVDKSQDNGLVELKRQHIAEMIGFFLSQDYKFGSERRIRLQGGEPSLCWDSIVSLIEKYASASVRFIITTNGHALDMKKITFLKKHINCMDLVLSVDLEKWHIKDKRLVNLIMMFRDTNFVDRISYNITVSPSGQSDTIKLIKLLIKEGGREFRLSPAFYVKWSRNQLKILIVTFNKISDLIGDRHGDWIKFPQDKSRLVYFLDRFANISGIPLVNDSLTVDHNGDIFTSGVFILNYFRHIKDKFKIGNIEKLYNCKEKIKMLKENPGSLIKNLELNYAIYNKTIPLPIRKVNADLLNIYKQYVKLRIGYFMHID